MLHPFSRRRKKIPLGHPNFFIFFFPQLQSPHAHTASEAKNCHSPGKKNKECGHAKGRQQMPFNPSTAKGVKATRSWSAFKAKVELSIILPLEEFHFQHSYPSPKQQRGPSSSPPFHAAFARDHRTTEQPRRSQSGTMPCIPPQQTLTTCFLPLTASVLKETQPCWFGVLLPPVHFVQAQFPVGLWQMDFPQGCRQSAPLSLAK